VSRRRRAFAFALLLALAAAPAGAEVRRLEAVGSVPVVPGAPGAPRDAAIDEALREAVSRVAQDLLVDSETGEEMPSLEQVLGHNLVQYTRQFRILEDRGERPALFAENPAVSKEYVVVVSVEVDVERVQSRLVEAGLLRPGGPSAPGHRVRVEVEGLRDYAAYEALRKALVERAGARAAEPREFEPGRAVLEVESEDGGLDLLDRLEAHLPPGLAVRSLGASSDELRLAVEWTPPPADPAPGGERGAAHAPAGK
jgi:hypothetical protein